MSGASFRLETQLLGMDHAGLVFAELLLRMGDLTRPMDVIGNALVSSTQGRFHAGIGPDGKAWKPSARVEAEGGQTLVKDSHLMDSVTHQPGRMSVEVGTNKIYAGIHQFGGRITAKNGRALTFQIGGRWISRPLVDIPARPYLGISADDGDEIESELLDWLEGAAR